MSAARIGWLFKFAGLLGFAAILSPAFFRVAWSYYTDGRITRDVRYGPNPGTGSTCSPAAAVRVFGETVVDAERDALSEKPPPRRDR